MSGDWIKVRSNITHDPDVLSMASELDMDEFAVVGRLHALWAWADQHSSDGSLPHATHAFIDRLTACHGFAESLRRVGWLEGRDSALRLPNWETHNGRTAKARALEARKKTNQRDKKRDKCPAAVPIDAGPEKRREQDQDQEQSLAIVKASPARPEKSARAEEKPSAAGTICRELIALGVVQVNPSHASLVELLQAGVAGSVFVDTASELIERNAGVPLKFGYLLGTLRNRLVESAQRQPIPIGAAVNGHAHRSRTAQAIQALNEVQCDPNDPTKLVVGRAATRTPETAFPELGKTARG